MCPPEIFSVFHTKLQVQQSPVPFWLVKSWMVCYWWLGDLIILKKIRVNSPTIKECTFCSRMEFAFMV